MSLTKKIKKTKTKSTKKSQGRISDTKSKSTKSKPTYKYTNNNTNVNDKKLISINNKKILLHGKGNNVRYYLSVKDFSSALIKIAEEKYHGKKIQR